MFPNFGDSQLKEMAGSRMTFREFQLQKRAQGAQWNAVNAIQHNVHDAQCTLSTMNMLHNVQAPVVVCALDDVLSPENSFGAKGPLERVVLGIDCWSSTNATSSLAAVRFSD